VSVLFVVERIEQHRDSEKDDTWYSNASLREGM